jgi:hypothetical protein
LAGKPPTLNVNLKAWINEGGLKERTAEQIEVWRELIMKFYVHTKIPPPLVEHPNPIP